MYKKVNCVFFKPNGARCSNKNIKRRFFGLGFRLCNEYYSNNSDCFLAVRKEKYNNRPKPIKINK